MAGEFREFSAELEREMEALKEGIRETTAEIALDAYSSVIEKSPVDTGFFRNSWWAEIGDGASIENNGGSGGPTASEALAQAQPFDAITIANGAEYANILEQGHSKQAPNGVVAVTLSELRSKYRRVK